MEQQPNPSPEIETTERDHSRNSQVQALAQETRTLFEAGEGEAALAFFRQIHPADQGDILVELARELRQELLTWLTPDETAEILEHIEPEEAVGLFEGVKAWRFPKSWTRPARVLQRISSMISLWTDLGKFWGA